MSAKPRIRRFFIKALVTLAAALLIWHVTFRVRTHLAIQRLEAAIRAKGEPVTFAELAASHYGPIPDDENAAIPLLDLWEEDDPSFWSAIRRQEIPPSPRRSREIPRELINLNAYLDGQNMTPEERAATRVYLRQEHDRLERLHAAFQRGGARFPINLGRWYQTPLDYLAALRFEVALLARHAVQSADDGDRNAAVRTIIAVIRSGEILREDPWVLGALLRFATQNQAADILTHLVNQGGLNDTHLRELSEALRSLAEPDVMKRSLLVERVIAREVFHDMRMARDQLKFPDWEDDIEFFEELHDAKVLPHFLKWTGNLQADEAFFLGVMEQCVAHASLPVKEALAESRRTLENLHEDTATIPPRMLSRRLLYGLDNNFQRQAAWEARVHGARVVLAIERHRLAHAGRLPGSLAELVPAYLDAVPSDPFDGRPLRYQLRDVGYAVYSVGDDLVDDNGRKRRRSGPSPAPTFDESLVVTR